jgi:transcriptional regulator with PAS, ATPase and Fis domain
MGRFELAQMGTLFLDEVGNLSLSQQAKLLRVLEEKRYEAVGSSLTQQADVRLITATNADLTKEVKTQTFREDLYYRINTITLRVPSLRERKEDIPELAFFFLQKYARKHKREVAKIAEKAMKILESNPWPGNVRELSHTMERAVLFATGKAIEESDLGLPTPAFNPMANELEIYDLPLEDAEKILISHALKKAKGNAKQAQKALGLSKSSFYRRLDKFGL